MRLQALNAVSGLYPVIAHGPLCGFPGHTAFAVSQGLAPAAVRDREIRRLLAQQRLIERRINSLRRLPDNPIHS